MQCARCIWDTLLKEKKKGLFVVRFYGHKRLEKQTIKSTIPPPPGLQAHKTRAKRAADNAAVHLPAPNQNAAEGGREKGAINARNKRTRVGLCQFSQVQGIRPFALMILPHLYFHAFDLFYPLGLYVQDFFFFYLNFFILIVT